MRHQRGRDGQRDEHGERALPRPRRGQHGRAPRPRRPRPPPPTAGWVPATSAAQRAARGRGHRPRGRPAPRRPGPPSTATTTADRTRRSANASPCTSDRHDHGRDAERSGRPVAHHRQRALRRPVAAEPVGGVGKPVDVQAAGGEQQDRHREHAGERVARAERVRADPQSPRRPARRARRRPRAARSARRGRTAARAAHRQHRRRTRMRLRANGSRAESDTAPRRTWPSTPAWPPRRARSAARPRRRCPRRVASAGRRSVRVPAAAAPACARVRWSGVRPATTARAPGASRSATSAAAVTTTPSSSTGVRRTAAWAQKPAIAARSAPPQTRSSATGSAESRARPVQRVADRGGLAGPAGVVDPGAPADHGNRLGVGQRGDQCRCGRGVSDAHVAGDQQVGAGVDLLVGDPAARLDCGLRPRRRSARPRRRCCRCSRRTLCAPIDGDSGSSASTAMSTTRTVAPARLGQHVDRRAAGVEVGHHLRGHLGGKRRHAGGGDAVVAGEHHHARPLELPWRAHALARRHPDRQLLEPAQRAGRLGQRVLAGPGRAPRRPSGRGGVIVGKSVTIRLPSRSPAVRPPPAPRGRTARPAAD